MSGEEFNMKPETVIVLQDHKRGSMIDMLNRQGITPKFTSSIQDVLEKIRHANYDALLVDCNQSRVDVLELILNVRDIEDNLPIILIVGKSTDRHCYEPFFSFSKIYLVNKENGDDWLAQQLQKLLNKETLTGDQLS